MGKGVAKNYIYNLIYQIFLIIVPILVTPYVARVLGKDGTGQYAFSCSIVTYFSLFASLGFKNYGQRLVASHQGDLVQQSKDFWEVFYARLIPTAVTVGIYVVLIFAGFYDGKYYRLMMALSLEVIAVAFDITFYFQGNEEFGTIVIRNIVIKLLGFICIFVFVKEGSDLWKYTLIQSTSVLLSNVSLWICLRHVLKKIQFSDLKILRHLPASFILFLPTIATSIYTSLDKTLIGVITKIDSENGNYEYAEKLVKMAMVCVTSLGTVLIPRNSMRFARGDINGVIENIYKSARFVFFLGVPLAFGCLAISDNLIPWFLGDQYDKASQLMKILSPIIVIIGLSNVFGLQYLIPSMQDQKFTVAIILGAISNFTLNIFMINWWKSYGAAIATVIAETVVTVVMAVYIRDDIKLMHILVIAWKYLVAGIIMFVPCNFLSHFLFPSPLHSIAVVIVGAVIYFTALLIMKEEFIRLILINKIRR